MYQVVLVDDERLILRGLQTVVNWAEIIRKRTPIPC